MSRDPDLDQAIEDLRYVVTRLRQLDQLLLKAKDPMRYHELAALKTERGEAVEKIQARAERLNLPWRSLLLIVEEGHRLERKHRRKPSASILMNAVRHASELAERDRAAAEAEHVLTTYDLQLATGRVSAAKQAIQYMEASR